MPQRILIVDDDPEVADMMAVMLELHGYEVQKVHGTMQGMTAVLADPPDLVLLDMMMPHLSGLELCRYIRRDPALFNLPIVFFSARSDDAQQREAMIAGATAFVKKTAGKDELLDTIRSALAA
jgi:CheY-like chemotaxis protein